MNLFKPVIAVFALVLAVVLALLSACCKPAATWLARHLDGVNDLVLPRVASFAVVAVSSTLITNADALPVIETPAYQAHGRLRQLIESVSIANGDSVGSVYRTLRVWSGWRVDELLIDAPDIGTTTVADVGLYKTAQNGGAVVDADFFASLLVLNAGALAKVDIARESGVITIANADKRIWEQLGLTADPKIWYDIALTLTGAADAAGEIGLRCNYVDGS